MPFVAQTQTEVCSVVKTSKNTNMVIHVEQAYGVGAVTGTECWFQQAVLSKFYWPKQLKVKNIFNIHIIIPDVLIKLHPVPAPH